VTDAAGACRVDVWLWHARFARTRALAAALAESGRIRLTHQGRQVRLDKPSRTVHVGDTLVFARGGRLICVRIEAMGQRRGPPEQARALYSPVTGEA
jgi:ribosome-associated heat shock protein Hsp15